MLGEGTHMNLYEKLGAHPMVFDGVAGVAFAVFAPAAKRVSWLAISIYGMDAATPCACAAMAFGKFVPEARAGDKYKYEIVGPDGHLLPLKSDPLAFAAELRPQTASIVVDRDTIPQPQPAPAGIKLVLLKAIAPRVSRVTAIFNPAMARRGGAYYLASIEAARGRGKSLARFTSSRAFEAFYGCPWKLHADFDRGGGCRPPIVLVSARRRSNIRAVWHLDEFEVPNVRAAPRVHRFPADFTVRQTVILGHGFVVPNFVYCPAVGAFKSFCHLKNILWLGVGFQTGFDGEVAIAVAQLYLARMLQRILPAGFIAPCLPTKTDNLPSGSQWLHEIKHDGFRIIARSG